MSVDLLPVVVITNALNGGKNYSYYVRLSGAKYNRDDSPPPAFKGEDDKNVSDGSGVRKVFPETWIGDNGEFMLDTIVPDTITSFIVSGCAIHPLHGISIAVPRKITVFKEFFTKLFVPYSI